MNPSSLKCATCTLLHCCCDANIVADQLGVSPLYHQLESQRWNEAAHMYQGILEQGPPSPPPSPVKSPQATSDAIPVPSSSSSIRALPMRRYKREERPSRSGKDEERKSRECCSECHSPDLGRSPSHPTVLTLQRLVAEAPALCDSLPNLVSSVPMSLNKVSTLNRSLAGTRNESRAGGESSLELEAIAAVHELSFAVQSISVSEMLPRTPELIFVNVTTIEGQPFCLELTLKGWRITSLRLDCMIGDFTKLEMFTAYYDSLYSLMDQISPGYREKFGEKLAQKLRLLQAGEDMEVVAPNASYSSPQLSRSSSPSSPRSVHSTDSLPISTPKSSPTVEPVDFRSVYV